MKKPKETRETKSSDWKTIDSFFEEALKAYESGEMDSKQFRYWITHFIGLANNAGIDSVITGMKNSLETVKKQGWKP